MPHVIWENGALRDLDRLYFFLARKNRSAAIRAVVTIRTEVGLLADHPLAGRHADPISGESRELAVHFGKGAYLILYQVQTDRVLIQAARHSRELGYEERLSPADEDPFEE